ncbi:hypothetical protein BDN71DRAFT_1494712 [Pleurotus eryngii]|uniref:Acetolactate synthase n=1 Tax=Pleurotus eryngii TaxID=5323 RepID=A0A9P6DHF0_PLEER|nr:hypothetical protein BDN71DRAFT_1494712 [Pleurotus eryngii]
MPMIFLFTTCTLCALFLLWRRAETLRNIVSQTLHLKTWSNSEGNIRLSEDDGPSSREFLDNDDDDDAPVLDLTDSRSLMDVSSEARLAFSDSPPRSPPPPPIPTSLPTATSGANCILCPICNDLAHLLIDHPSIIHAPEATLPVDSIWSRASTRTTPPRSTRNASTTSRLATTPSRSLAPSRHSSLLNADAQAFVGLSGSQIILNVLARNGVEHAFAYPGAANVHLLDVACTDLRIKLFMPRHEQGAGRMAEGYSRVAGKTGVALVTSGPGATNVITALQDAMSDGILLVAIAGQVATKELGTGAFQDADIVSMTQPCTKWATMVGDVEDLPAYIDEAFRPPLPQLPKPPAAKVLKSINEAAARILSSPDGPRLLKELALRGNIPVATTLHGLGAFDEDHPLSLHMLGVHGSVYDNYAVQRADTILVLGARLDDHVTANIDGFAAAARSASREILEPLIEPHARNNWLEHVNEWRTKFPFDDRFALTRMANLDFALLAQSMGVHAIECRTTKELPEKLKEFMMVAYWTELLPAPSAKRRSSGK